ncbi:MAG: hypothetical protein V9E85_10685 [Candidatus Nanopelagicales bacterium]
MGFGVLLSGPNGGGIDLSSRRATDSEVGADGAQLLGLIAKRGDDQRPVIVAPVDRPAAASSQNFADDLFR